MLKTSQVATMSSLLVCILLRPVMLRKIPYLKQQTWKLKIVANQTVGNRSDVEKKEQTQGVFAATKKFTETNVNANIGHKKTLAPTLQHFALPTIQVDPQVCTSGLVATTATIQHLIHAMPKLGKGAVLIRTAIAVDRTTEGGE